MADDITQYPVAIIEDRYSGVYSGGRWIAIAEWSRMHDVRFSRLGLVDAIGNGDDLDAAEFWGPERPEWLAVGGTAEEALANLRRTPAGLRSEGGE